MKFKCKFRILTIAIVFLFCSKAYSQAGFDWQLVGNVIVGGNFLGTTNPQALHIQTMLDQPIRFRTNYAAATAGLGNRQIITDGGFGPLDGRIAMGNNLPDAFDPVDRLHLNQNTGTTAIRFYK